jgi:hypothetical protein
MLVVCASLLAIVATPPAAYFAIGDQSTVGPAMDPDFAFRPPSWSPALVRLVGLVALVAFVVAVGVLVRQHRRSPILRATLIVDALLIVAGVIVAGGYRVATAGVIGANIGAGIVILFGTPFVAGLVNAAGVVAYCSHRKQSSIR